MKIIALIFSMYMLALSCLAYVETGMCTDDVQNPVTQTGDHPEDEKEDCGSFCTCSCCVHIVSVNFQSQKIVAERPFAKNNLHLYYHNISLPSNYFGNIWQPPRIS